MKRNMRLLSIAISLCMALGLFALAPGAAYAEVDVTPPTIGEPVVASSASSPYHAGDTIVMTVDIQDESGIDVSTLYTDIYNPKGYVEPVYGENVSGNSYRFTYVIPENPWPGVWSFFYVVCSDLSSNANQEGRYIYDVAQFTVEATPTTDTTAPNISNISVTPTQNNPNDTVTVSATLTDNVAVHHAFFTLISPSNVEYTNNILSKVGETDTWSGGFALPSGAESGIWSVKISAYDAASNVSNQTLGNMFSVSVTFTSVTGVTLNTRSINLSVGANQTLTANISPDNATNQNVEWTSTKPNIAKVDQNGKVTAVSPGAAAITVKTVDGAFTDTCNVTVKPLAIGAAVISPIAGVTYDGKAQTPALTVKHGGTTLAAGKDFTIGWTSNVNAGTAKVTITGKGNYSGTKTATFIIARANIAKLSFADISDKEWTGKKLAPVPAVKHGDLKLKNGTHFTVTHGANKNIGKGTLTIKAKSANYTGSVTRTFKIVPKAVAVSKAAPGKKQITVTWKKTDDTQKITKYEVRYRVKGAAEWKTATASAGSASLTIKKLSKGKVYQVQLRSYKTVNGVKYQSPWSTTKTSGKVK
ncbi:MAG: Ig-like domain-containing protein [Clostridiales Family XIII bacterium]|nr:Ig-like domain-containing protein [Clostridiales Family XIII bacterium]